MKIFSDNSNNNLYIVQSTASTSTMISSLAHFAKGFILSKFPPNYFKQVYIDSAQTISEINKNSRYNKTADKIPYPSLSMSVEMSLDDPIAGMEKSYHMQSPNLYIRKDINRTQNRIIIDPETKIGIYYTSDYITTNFLCKATTNSFIQNADLAFFIKSRFHNNFFEYANNENILTEIPKSFIRVIADTHGWNLSDPDEMDDLRLLLIGDSHSPDAVQKRVNQATGKDCFFINEKQNLLVLTTDLDAPSTIARDSQVESEYQITFRLQISCYLPNAFIMSIDRDTFLGLNQRTVRELESSDQQETGITSSAVLVSETFNKTLAKKDTIQFYDNQQEEHTGILIYDEKYFHKLGEDTIPDIKLMRKMKPEFKTVYSYAQYLNLDLSSLVHIIVVSSDNYQNIENYDLDYDSFTLSLNVIGSADVAVAVYVNRLLYDSIKEAMLTDKNYFNSGYLTSIYANVAGSHKKIMVRSFKNKDEWWKSDPDMSLRINTAYGVGYISLLPDNNKDGYKVCVGVDDNGEPVIRKFELNRNINGGN